ncbi:MAG: hypothetical protein FJ319_13295 [SAR202 cluster bacterium]|nr:hypothetical protein [SAR202 cluster bacterium]
MPIACVLITHFPLKVELQRRPDLKGKSVIVARTARKENEIVDFSPDLKGLHRGGRLSEALSSWSNVHVVEADDDHYQKAFNDILVSLLRYNPAVEQAEVGIAYAEMDGMELLYGETARMVATFCNAVPSPFGARIGTGPNKFVAYLAAGVAAPCGAYKAPDGPAAFIRSFPVDCLPVDMEIRQRLHMLHLDRLGDVADIGVGPLQSQFGPQGKLIWELANGTDNRPVIPMKPEESVTESLGFPYEVSSMDTLLSALDVLLRKAFGRPEMRGKFPVKTVIQCSRANTPTWSKTFHLREGIGDAARAFEIVKGTLGADRPDGPFETVAVTLSDFRGEPSRQDGLVPRANGIKRDLAEIDRLLRARTKERSALYHILPIHPAHPVPEMRAIQVSVDPSAGSTVKTLQRPSPLKVLEGAAIPKRLHVGERTVRISSVLDSWKIKLWWMAQPVERLYYKLGCSDGNCITVFQDLGTGEWFEQSY